MIRCTKCGTLNEGDASFCSECNSYLEWSGEKVEDPAAPAAPAPPVAPAAPAVPETPSNVAPKRLSKQPSPAAAAATAATSGSAGTPSAAPPEAAAPAARPPAAAEQPKSRRPVKAPAAPPSKPRPAQPAKVERPGQGERICANCGSGNDPQRKFCRRCGQNLALVPVAPIAAAPVKVPWYRRLGRGKPPPTAYAAGTRPGSLGSRRTWRPGCASLVVGLLVVLGVGGAAAYLTVPSVSQAIDAAIRSVTDRVEGRTLAVPAAAGVAAADHAAPDAVDRNLATWWLGPRGQDDRWALDLDFERPVDLRSINVHSGAQGDEYLAHGRPRNVRLRVGAELSDTFTLEDIEDVQAIPVDYPGIENVRLIVVDTYRGSLSANDVAIRELEFEVAR